MSIITTTHRIHFKTPLELIFAFEYTPNIINHLITKTSQKRSYEQIKRSTQMSTSFFSFHASV